MGHLQGAFLTCHFHLWNRIIELIQTYNNTLRFKTQGIGYSWVSRRFITHRMLKFFRHKFELEFLSHNEPEIHKACDRMWRAPAATYKYSCIPIEESVGEININRSTKKPPQTLLSSHPLEFSPKRYQESKMLLIV